MVRAVIGLVIVGGMVYYSPERDRLAGAGVPALGGIAPIALRGLLDESKARAALTDAVVERVVREIPAAPARVISLTPPRP